MLTIMPLACPEIGDRRWPSFVVFLALTEQRRSKRCPGLARAVLCRATLFQCPKLQGWIRTGSHARPGRAALVITDTLTAPESPARQIRDLGKRPRCQNPGCTWVQACGLTLSVNFR